MSIGSFIEERAADAILPGSGEALSLFHRIKPAIPYILGVIAALVVAFVIWRAPWAESRQKAKDYALFQPKLATALNREQIALKSLTSADNAIRVQSASIIAMGKAEAVKLEVAQKAIADAHKLDVARNTVIANLRQSAAKPLPGAPCEASEATKGAWQ